MKILEKHEDGATVLDFSRDCPICGKEIRIIAFETTDAYSFQPIYTIHYNSEFLAYICGNCSYKISLFKVWEDYKNDR